MHDADGVHRQGEGFSIEIDKHTTPTSVASERLYTAQFFQVFAAVALFMIGNSLQYHFGEYVAFLGFGVDTLGFILSISMVAALLMRLRIGAWIDRFGCKPTWIAGSIVTAAAVAAMQWAQTLWVIVLLRTIVMLANAAVMTTVAVFAAQIAPAPRRAESIGTVGLAGLVGMMIGPTLGDWIFSSAESASAFRVFFSASAVCALASCGVMMFLAVPGRNENAHAVPSRPLPGSREPLTQLRIIFAHWPGMVMLVGIVFAMALCFQMVFLERFADARGFVDIKQFFLVYCPAAIGVRVFLRRMPERFGRGRTLLVGLVAQSAGLLLLSTAARSWDLILPGLLMGAGHGLIFPSKVDLAAERLPPEYRGTGTSLILGAGDLGLLIGYAALGQLIDGLGFEATIRILAGVVLSAAAMFAYAQRGQVFSRRDIPVEHA